VSAQTYATAAYGETTAVVRAAGGVIVRRTGRGPTHVAVIHRPDRADWSFPKGKLEPGEPFDVCALREVWEETGYRCRLVQFIGHTLYRDRKDRSKVVAYWTMEVESGVFVANEEVDELRWIEAHAAHELLSYARDRELLAMASVAEELVPAR
jgi:8-oxo-dGTP diphosphatase